MINVQDYKAYIHHNYNFLELLRENNSYIYERLNDVLKVLGYIEMLVDDEIKVNEDLEVIFEVGFSYLHEQLEEIKVYYNTYFNRDYPLFRQYEQFINYSLYLDDLEEVLKEKKLYSVNAQIAIKEIADDIDNVLLNKLNPNKDLFEKFNNLIEANVPIGTITTLEVFGMIVEELTL